MMYHGKSSPFELLQNFKVEQTNLANYNFLSYNKRFLLKAAD